MKEALDIEVHGIVQGVGFRPFIYKIARRHLINGWVLNATAGVFIHAEGESKDIDDFVMEISDNAPAASRVDEILMKERAVCPERYSAPNRASSPVARAYSPGVACFGMP